LIAKQTADDARFNYLKNLGSSIYNNKNNFNNVNKVLRIDEDGINIKDSNNEVISPQWSIRLSPDLYESEIPYLFHEKDFKRGVSADLPLSGFEIDKEYIFIIISPETIGKYDFSKLSTDIDNISKDYTKIRVLIFPQTLDTLKLEYRSEILEIFQTKGILVTLVRSNKEIFDFTKSFLGKQ
jgi:hypothetical protein